MLYLYRLNLHDLTISFENIVGIKPESDSYFFKKDRDTLSTVASIKRVTWSHELYTIHDTLV